MKNHITITLESELYNILRKKQTARNAETNESMSFSQTIEEILTKGIDDWKMNKR